jgi:hypothetical protein
MQAEDPHPAAETGQVSPTPIDGSCSCRVVTFRVKGDPRFVCHCHCDHCRHAHGAAFVTWAGFPVDALQVLTGQDSITQYHTETDASRSFCSNCGSPLFYSSPRWDQEIHVAVAQLSGDLPIAPKAHVYADRRPSWCPSLQELPRFGGADGLQELGPLS